VTTLQTQSIRQTARRVQSGALSARAVTESYLERIAQFDGRLGCYLHVDAEGARRRADAVDKRVADGGKPGALAGVPLGIKDLFCTRGVPTTAASRILQGFVPPYESTVTERLYAEGAVGLGKLNLDEFAMGSSNENSAFQPVRNPWDLKRVPGGSSGGSAAAVAASLCSGSLGTDTGGSIRQPAAFCGVTGLKATYGRVSRQGVIAFASSLDHPGPLGRSAEDVAALLEVMAGFDDKDATSLNAPVGRYVEACGAGISGLRIGVPKEYFGGGLEPGVGAAVEAAMATFKDQGATLVDVTLPHTQYAVATYYLICTAEAASNLARYDGIRYGRRSPDAGSLEEVYVRSRGEGFGDEPKRRIILGTYVLRSGFYDAYYGKAQRVRRKIAEDFAQAFTHCDVLLTPTSPMTAFAAGEKVEDPLQMYMADVFTVAPSLAGLPSLSLCCGFLEKLPVGLQLIGPALGEETVFRAAGAYQSTTDWHLQTPDESLWVGGQP